ncbi:MAG TPA: sorbosone dehydrogenase family protein [Nitrospirae bacterium]|nr:sorbosone dehydrogenase family protein [Nitrospirota bacterium]
MKPQLLPLLAALALCLLFTSAPSAKGLELQELKLLPGFQISIFSDGLDLKGPRFMAYGPDGVLYVTLTRSGKVVALPDGNDDGVADSVVTVARGLDRPHGIAFYNGYVYIAETGKIIRFKQDRKSLKLVDNDVVVHNLPTKGGGHFTRTIAFGPDGKMYVSVGSSCNVCEEKDSRRSAILRFDPDGSNPEIYAEGLRNAVGIVFHPVTGELFGTDNGRDWLGDDLPPDEVNQIAQGAHYGWPWCYGKRIPDKSFSEKAFCAKTKPSVIDIQAHSAPLGLRFYDGDMFPDEFHGALFIAFHGSWNRDVPTGYKIVLARTRDNVPTGIYEDFITGWLKGETNSGRPVDLILDPAGALLISDDYAGVIYRVTYDGKQ